MKHLISRINEFNLKREWGKFHTPENLAKSIVIESSELLENFQWESGYNIDNLKDEVADIFLYLIMFAESVEIDLISAANQKIDKNEGRYSIEKSKGHSKKYTEF